MLKNLIEDYRNIWLNPHKAIKNSIKRGKSDIYTVGGEHNALRTWRIKFKIPLCYVIGER